MVAKEHKRFLVCIVFSLCLISSFSQTVNDIRPTVTMKEYVDMRAEMIEKMNALRDDHQKEISRIKDENIKTAYAAQDKRLDGMNEFRDALKDSNATYVTWPALLGLIFGTGGFIFGYANYKRNQQANKDSSKNIVSGDKVEVKK